VTKWLPSRHHFALARLVAYVMLAGGADDAMPNGVDRVILAKDRYQSAIENYTATVWYLAILVCFLAAFVPLIVALPLALMVVEIPIYAFGLPFRSRRITSMGYVLCGAAEAWYLALQRTWIRAGAYAFFGVVALNALAFVVMWLLRGRVRAAEERCTA